MKKGLSTLLLLLFAFTSIHAQQHALVDWSYKAYPDLPFIVNHIELDLEIEPQNALIRGAGTYEISSRRPGLTEIIFNTSDIDIKDVSVKNSSVEYRVSSDSLIILLADTLRPGSKIELLIDWESTSPYGINTDVYGNIWTSLNPKARHHWIPIPDHPEVETTLNASLTVPAEQQVILNGSMTGDQVVSTDEKTVQWESQKRIPVSGLSVAVGNFVKESARAGVKQVSIYASEDALIEEVRSGLLLIAVESLKSYEEKLAFEFPYESLHIVVLPDHKWEEIQAGAGIVYLYQNLGSLSTQLRRGIAEQWFGNYHRYLNAPDNKYEFLKALVTGTSDTEQLQNPDELQSVYRWNLWEQGIENIENDHLKETILGSLPQILQKYQGVTNWNQYADHWYDRTGTFWETLPAPNTGGSESDESYVYEVDYLYDEMNASLTLVFEAINEPIETLVGVEVMEFSFMDTNRTVISFTGALDSVTVDISSEVEYLTLDPVAEVEVELRENKPFLFLIRQLRSSDPDVQIQAANQLHKFTDKPDLQLALQDVLNTEENTDVRAVLTRTLGMITQGASGTEQTFLENLRSENLAIRLSGLRALANYPGNDQVAYAVRNAILRSENDTLFSTALNTYKQLVGAEDLLSLTERLERAGSSEKAIEALQIATPADTSGQAVTIADRFALGSFPYSIRKKAFDLLLNNQQDPQYWSQALETLLQDRDPRIRYHALDAVKHLSSKRAVELLVERSKEEMDPRVLGKIRDMMK